MEEDADELTADLVCYFERREALQIGRVQQVLDLVTHSDCQVNALVGYFGEARPEEWRFAEVLAWCEVISPAKSS